MHVRVTQLYKVPYKQPSPSAGGITVNCHSRFFWHLCHNSRAQPSLALTSPAMVSLSSG